MAEVGWASWTCGMVALVYLSRGLRSAPLVEGLVETLSAAAWRRAFREEGWLWCGGLALLIWISPSEREEVRGRRLACGASVRNFLGCGVGVSAMETSSVRVGLRRDWLLLVAALMGEGEEGGEGDSRSLRGVVGLGAGVESGSECV
jgi:hypothetical protein